MQWEQAVRLGDALAREVRWVGRIAVRENAKAEGGFCLSLWPINTSPRGRDLVWSLANREYRQLFSVRSKPRRNRDIALETRENSLRELW